MRNPGTQSILITPLLEWVDKGSGSKWSLDSGLAHGRSLAPQTHSLIISLVLKGITGLAILRYWQ